MTLTGTLSSNYEGAIADVCDIVLTGNIEREFETKGEGENAKNYLVNEERRLYFRGTELIMAGSRFAPGAVPDYIVFDGTPEEFAKKLIDTIERGMENSKSANGTSESKPVAKAAPISAPAPAPVEEDPEIEAMSEQIDEEDDMDLPFDLDDEDEDDSFDEEAVKEEINALFKNADAALKKEVRGILNGGKLANIHDEATLKRILEALS